MKIVLPARPWTHLCSIRARNHETAWLRQTGVLELGRRFSDIHGATVLHGPFAGLRYPASAIGSRNCVPKLLGSYERELHPILDSALGCEYQRVIDIGSAEGYYAVGFAVKAGRPVITFDTDPRELRRCREMARLNAVEALVDTRSWCSPEILRAATNGVRCFVLSDCEGYESELFNEAALATMIRCDILIETHGDTYQPLDELLAKTHAVQTLVAVERSTQDYPELACLGEGGPRAVAEYRPEGQRWLFARSRMV